MNFKNHKLSKDKDQKEFYKIIKTRDCNKKEAMKKCYLL